jgi:hypothetical protein
MHNGKDFIFEKSLETVTETSLLNKSIRLGAALSATQFTIIIKSDLDVRLTHLSSILTLTTLSNATQIDGIIWNTNVGMHTLGP